MKGVKFCSSRASIRPRLLFKIMIKRRFGDAGGVANFLDVGSLISESRKLQQGVLKDQYAVVHKKQYTVWYSICQGRIVSHDKIYLKFS